MNGRDRMTDMVIENYRTAKSVGDARKVIRRVDRTPSFRSRLLRGLNLESLISSEDATVRLQSAQLLWPELLPSAEKLGENDTFDFNVWGKFLPTRRRLQDYKFDSIPVDALQFIDDADALRVFNGIEIWTPEGNDAKSRIDEWSNAHSTLMDPMAVGYVDTGDQVRHYFSIVRWGESLEPYENIKKYVAKVDREIVLRLITVPVGLLAIMAVFVVLSIIMPWTGNRNVDMLHAFMIVVSVFTGVYGFGWLAWVIWVDKLKLQVPHSRRHWTR